MKETFRKDFELFLSVKIRQTNKSLTYCMYKNDIITVNVFLPALLSGGVLVIMRTITSNNKHDINDRPTNHIVQY